MKNEIPMGRASSMIGRAAEARAHEDSASICCDANPAYFQTARMPRSQMHRRAQHGAADTRAARR